jgi:hypothetical protein
MVGGPQTVEVDLYGNSDTTPTELNIHSLIRGSYLFIFGKYSNLPIKAIQFIVLSKKAICILHLASMNVMK